VSAVRVARVWHGRVAPERADAYAAFLAARAVPDYRAVAGNLGVHVLREDAVDATHFLTLTFWTSEDAIRGFAGEDVLQAKYYPEDAAFLLEFEPTVRHYRVVAGG
jgi:heme-degrading monooxygenase HmoA